MFLSIHTILGLSSLTVNSQHLLMLLFLSPPFSMQLLLQTLIAFIMISVLLPYKTALLWNTFNQQNINYQTHLNSYSSTTEFIYSQKMTSIHEFSSIMIIFLLVITDKIKNQSLSAIDTYGTIYVLMSKTSVSSILYT